MKLRRPHVTVHATPDNLMRRSRCAYRLAQLGFTTSLVMPTNTVSVVKGTLRIHKRSVLVAGDGTWFLGNPTPTIIHTTKISSSSYKNIRLRPPDERKNDAT